MTAHDNSPDKEIDMVVPESWVAYGVDPEVARMITEGFPDAWMQVAAIVQHDHAQNIAEENARYSRNKNLEPVATASLPTPFQSPTQAPPDRKKQLINQFIVKHYPDAVIRAPVNPFKKLLDNSQQGVSVSANDWRTAAHDLATTLLESGKRVSSPSKPTPSPVPTTKESVSEPVQLPPFEPPIEAPKRPPTPQVVEPAAELPTDNTTLLHLSQYPGRFEWDKYDGCFIEK